MNKWDVSQECKVDLTSKNISIEEKTNYRINTSRKSTDKIPFPLMINTCNKLGIVGNFLNLINGI